jgi:hypothetical protein
MLLWLYGAVLLEVIGFRVRGQRMDFQIIQALIILLDASTTLQGEQTLNIHSGALGGLLYTWLRLLLRL